MATYGVGILGPGWVAGEYVKAFGKNPQTEVVALCSRSQERAEQKARAWGLDDVALYTDYQRMLADPRVDVVAICTPNCAHVEPAILGAQAGKHLVIEKPAACAPQDLRRMVAAVERAGVRTIVGFVLHWYPLCRIVKRLVDEGTLGRLVLGEVNYWNPSRNWAPPDHWVFGAEQGGGAMLTGGCHAVDALRWWVGSDAVEVMALAGAPNPHYGYPPTVLAMMRFANGVIGKASASLEPNMPYALNFHLLGHEGVIRDNKLWAERYRGQHDWVEIPAVGPNTADVAHHPFGALVDELVDCIMSGQETSVSLASTINSHEIAFAAEQSALEGGRPIALPLPQA